MTELERRWIVEITDREIVVIHNKTQHSISFKRIKQEPYIETNPVLIGSQEFDTALDAILDEAIEIALGTAAEEEGSH